MAAIYSTFGPFVLDGATLTRDGHPVALGGRGAALLAALVRAEGEVVSKDELIEAAWPGTMVEEGNLSVQISSLRKSLGPAPGGQEWIATVPRVGYRLLRLQGASTPFADPPPSLAVLPFANLSGDQDQEYFVDGMVEDVITALSRFRSFAVIARNSSFAYKGRAIDVRQVATELGVRYLLEGSVRRVGKRLRVTAQLIDGESGAHLWAESFDGAIDDVFDVQDSITQSVVALIEPKIQSAELDRSRRKRPDSVDAYDLYLRALPSLFGVGPEENASGLALLDRAIALAPKFAAAMSSAAWCLEHRASMGWPSLGANDERRGLELARAAIAIADDDAVALAHSGRVLQVLGREYDQGLLVIKRAVRANPNNVTVLLCAGIGHLHGGDLEEALSYFLRVVRLSPSHGFAAMTGAAHAKLCLRAYQEALDWAERSLAENVGYEATHWMRIAANAHLGRIEASHRALAEFLAIAPHTTLHSVGRAQHTKDPARVDVLIDGMRLAGMAET
jgi:TolB-like protein